MNKVTEEELKYDEDKTLQASHSTSCVNSHNLQLVTLAQLWGLEEQIKMQGSFIGFRQKSTTSAVSVLILQQQASTAATVTQRHLGFPAV